MPLDRDNMGHRNFSNNLDSAHTGKAWYDLAARPIVHGAYHAGRFVNSGNPEEWARAKDQFSKFGTGQTQTEYLKAHREAEAKAIQEALAKSSTC